MKIERHETGPRMSKAVIHGDTVYLAGIVADSPKGKGVAEQTRSILSQIDNFLPLAGTNKTKLRSANIWITDMAHFGEMNTVWDAWVSPGNTPARATVEAKLALNTPDTTTALNRITPNAYAILSSAHRITPMKRPNTQ
jgi:enamine deaminase RidA (YjgF/YER057c/UK114 family)